MGIESLKRVDGWERRLRLLIEDARAKPFEWGHQDCCTFAIEDFVAMHNAKPPNVEPWGTMRKAQRLLKRHSVREWGRLWFGREVDGWAVGRRGDIALVDSSRGNCPGDALAVVAGALLCCPGEDGLDFLPLSAARAIWRI